MENWKTKMLYAIDGATKIKATPHKQAYCPGCGEVVISKCGEINIWHWAHKIGADCETWNEPETDWHLEWKSYWPTSCVEIQIIKDGIKHRADILLPNGLVIEFQHSPISPHR